MTASAVVPLHAALFVGGASRRMGRPKQLLAWGGTTFAARIAATAGAGAASVVLVGEGEAPTELAALERVADRAGIGGPLAGLLGLFDLRPDMAWLALACDQPEISPAALAWLAAERRAGAIAVMPRFGDEAALPFPAIYEPASRAALEALAGLPERERSPAALGRRADVRSPRVPAALVSAFAGANSPEELERLRAAVDGPGAAAPTTRGATP